MGERSQGHGRPDYQHERKVVRALDQQLPDARKLGTYQEPNWHVQVCAFPPCSMSCCLCHVWRSFTGLQTEQCKALAEKAHVYMTMDGRISMAGLNSSNIEYFAQSVDAAVRGNL